MDADPTLIRRDGLLDERARRFLDAARTATLATIALSGRARLVPVCFVVGRDDAAGRIRLYSPLDDKPKSMVDPRGLARVRDVLARPDVTLLVDRWSEDWDRLGWLRLEATADLLEPGPGSASAEHDDAVTDLRAKYPHYARHRLEERPILRFRVDRAVSWGELAPD